MLRLITIAVLACALAAVQPGRQDHGHAKRRELPRDHDQQGHEPQDIRVRVLHRQAGTGKCLPSGLGGIREPSARSQLQPVRLAGLRERHRSGRFHVRLQWAEADAWRSTPRSAVASRLKPLTAVRTAVTALGRASPGAVSRSESGELLRLVAEDRVRTGARSRGPPGRPQARITSNQSGRVQSNCSQKCSQPTREARVP
jgi:hypothetical protein